MKRFSKPAITVSEQVALLKKRGLLIKDEEKAQRFLEVVSFFRLSPYMRPYQVSSDMNHGFRPGSGFKQLSRLYDFDRRLRLLVTDAVERVEVAVRTGISNYMGPKYGAHWYLSRRIFKDNYDHERLLVTVTSIQERAIKDYLKEVRRIDGLSRSEMEKQQLKDHRAKESYARHYVLTYREPSLMPGWAVLESLTLGDLSHLFRGLGRDRDRKAIGSQLDVPAPLLESWLHTLTSVRNICAHHGRLWNRELGIKPSIPKQHGFPWPRYLHRGSQHTRIVVILAMLHYLMQKTSPQTCWRQRLINLLSEFPDIPIHSMGLPTNWHEDSFWCDHH